MKSSDFEPAVMFTPSQAGSVFGVDPKTFNRWSEAGKIAAHRTVGGHRRYKAVDVYALRDRDLGTVEVEEEQ